MPYLQNRLPGDVSLKEKPVRSVVVAGGLVIKTYRIKGLIERLKYMFVSSKAMAEWHAAQLLNEAGISTIVPVAFGEKREGGLLEIAYFAAVEIEDAGALRDRASRCPAEEELGLARAAAELAHTLHRTDV